MNIVSSGAFSGQLTVKTIFAMKPSLSRRLICMATVASLGAAASISAAAVPTTQPTNAQLAAQNAALAAKVSQLEAKVDQLQNQQDKSQRQIDQAVQQDVLKDADAHSRLFSTTGEESFEGAYQPGLGFILSSADGAFTLHPGAVFDFRYETNIRESIPKGGGGEAGGIDQDTQSNFNMAKARLTFDGHFTEPLTYYVQLEADQGTALTLLDAFGTYHIGDSPWSIRAGQFKDPVWHERNLPETALMAVDRSLVENLVGSGGSLSSRVEGAALIYDQDQLRAQAVLHHGFDSANSKFITSGGFGSGVRGANGVTPMDWGTSGRVEYVLLGQRSKDLNPFTQYDKGFTALGAKQQILVLGGGADYSQAGANDLLLHSVDLQYDNPDGLSLYGAYYGAYRDLHHNEGVAPGNYYDPGLELQAAYLVTPVIEPFVRYDYSYLALGSVSSSVHREVQEITTGVNYYFYHQNLKFTVDGTWLPDGAPTDVDSEGFLLDSGHNEFVLRAQVQLAI